jgi:recombination protein RecA
MARPRKNIEINDYTELSKAVEQLGGQVSKSLKDLEPEYFIPTGLLSLDKAISATGGVPGNCCIEVFGPNTTGKTSLALQIACFAQELDIEIFYINAERAINTSIIACFPKLKADKIKWINIDKGEDAIRIMTYLLKTQPKILVINDSIPACLPSQIQDANPGEATVASLARLFSPFMPDAKKFCNINNSVLIQLNQIRHKIGYGTGGTDTPGGESIKFYSDVRVELKRRYPSPEIKSGGEVIGHYVAAKVVKTRWGVPFQVAELPLIYGSGFDSGRELLDYAVSFNVINKKGAWFNFYEENADPSKDEPIWKAQGADQSATILRQNAKYRKMVRDRVLEIIS